MLLSDAETQQAGADIWENAKAELAAQGCTVADLKSEGSSGISAMRHFQKVEDLADAGNGSESIFSGANPAFSIRARKGFFATTYDIHAAIDPTKIVPLPTQANRAGMQLGQVQITMAIALPTKASSQNATSVSADGLTYTWELNPTQANNIELSASVPNMGNILLAGGGAVLVLAAFVVVLVIGARRRKAAQTVLRRAAGRGR